MKKPTLDYEQHRKKESADSVVGALAPALFVVLPVVGYAMHSGLLFIFGGMATVPAAIVALIGLFSSARRANSRTTGARAFSAVICCGAAAYFIWLFQYRGIC